MIFGLEPEGGGLIAPMALAHPLHLIHNRSRNKRQNLCIYTTGVSFSIGEAAPHHVLYDCISREYAVPGRNATFCFLWFTNCVLLFDKSLILGCLWPLVFVLTNTLILGILCSTIPHSVESPSMVDPQGNIWYWGSKWNLHTVCWSANGCEWSTTSVYFGINYVCFIPSSLCCWAPVPTSRFFIFVKSIIWITHTKSSKKFMMVWNLNGVCRTNID